MLGISGIWDRGMLLRADRDRARTSRTPTILIEAADGAIRWADESFLRREGFDVVTCSGPEELPKGRCPLVTEGRCTLAEQADVIVTHLRPSQDQELGVLRSLASCACAGRVIAEATEPQLAEYPEIYDRFREVRSPVTRTRLLRAVADVLAEQPHSSSERRTSSS